MEPANNADLLRMVLSIGGACAVVDAKLGKLVRVDAEKGAAFAAGEKVGEAGQSSSKNPHKQSTDDGQQWLSGWEAGTKSRKAKGKKSDADPKKPDPGGKEAKLIHGLLKGRTGGTKSDAARAFPSMTTAELKRAVDDKSVPEEKRARMRAEIAARESGASKPKVTPQVPWK